MKCSFHSTLNLSFLHGLCQDGTYADPATALSLGFILFRMVNGTQIIITDIEDLKFAVNVSKGERTALPRTR